MLNIEASSARLGATSAPRPVRAAQRAGSPPGQHPPLLRRLPPAPGQRLAARRSARRHARGNAASPAALLLSLAGREIARPEWDLEWLVTLPLPLSTLLASRLIERVVTNSSGFFTLVPFLSVLAWICGYRWTAPAARGRDSRSRCCSLVATVQILVDTGLRLSLSPPQAEKLSGGRFRRGVAAAVSCHVHGAARQHVRVRLGGAHCPIGRAGCRPVSRCGARRRRRRVGGAVVGPDGRRNRDRGRGRTRAAAAAIAQRRGRGGSAGSGRPRSGRTPRARPWTLDRRARVALAVDRAATRAAPARARPHVHGADAAAAGRDRRHADLRQCADSNIFADAVDHPSNLAAVAFGARGLYAHVLGVSDAECRRPGALDPLLRAAFPRVRPAAEGDAVGGVGRDLSADHLRRRRRRWRAQSRCGSSVARRSYSPACRSSPSSPPRSACSAAIRSPRTSSGACARPTSIST